MSEEERDLLVELTFLDRAPQVAELMQVVELIQSITRIDGVIRTAPPPTHCACCGRPF